MLIKKKALLYDISNLAYVIADTGQPLNHGLHRVRDICQEGNLDRVARILGLAYSEICAILAPILRSPDLDTEADNSRKPHDYCFTFKNEGELQYSLTSEIKLALTETCREYMVSMVLADWLSITLPEAADVWKFKLEEASAKLREIVGSLLFSSSCTLRRKTTPF